MTLAAWETGFLSPAAVRDTPAESVELQTAGTRSFPKGTKNIVPSRLERLSGRRAGMIIDAR
jgi:hypothetical protein